MSTRFSSLESKGIVIDQNYNDRLGYSDNFLGIKIPLPRLNPTLEKNASAIKGSKEYILKYHHFSLAMNSQRKLPFFTAVNIDGVKYNALKSQIPSRVEIGKDKWFIDKRINENDQIPKDFYKGNDFDLGHLVRREDPLWGDNLQDALKGNNDSFHLTNASPQHKNFNENAKRWLGLENYILQNARHQDHLLKVNVFTGPILNDHDMTFDLNNIKIKVPSQFWKVITMVKENGQLSCTGYMVTQFDLVEHMQGSSRGGFAFGQFQTYQRPIAEIENLTGITFNLNQFDPLAKKSRGIQSKSSNNNASILLHSDSDIIL